MNIPNLILAVLMAGVFAIVATFAFQRVSAQTARALGSL